MLDKIEADALALSGALTEDASEAEDRSRAAVLSLLRDLMDRAERGEIVAVGICAVHQSGAVATSIETGHAAHGWISLLGASSLLHERLIRHGTVL